MRSSPHYKIMSESPYMGWIVPHAWQEPEYGEEDETNEEIEDWSDYDPGDELSVKM